MGARRSAHRAAVIAAAFVAAMWAAPAMAQQPARSSGATPVAVPDSARRDPRLNLLRGITLTPAQRESVDGIESRFATRAAAADRSSTSAGETVAKLAGATDERHAAIRAVLTPAQRRIYDRNLEELRAWMKREAHH